VNQAVLQHLNPAYVEVEIWRTDELEVRRGLSSELDEMWSYVRSKAHPRWLWHAIEHRTGKGLAYVFGRRQDTVFLELKALLEPFGITRYFTDGWGGLRATCGGRAAHGGEGTHPEDREQTHQLAHADQAVGASDALLFEDGTHARLGDWPVYQSV
jgi:IS1 family transposase